MPGFIGVRPVMERYKLGKGGNGKVSKHYISGIVFAVKEVRKGPSCRDAIMLLFCCGTPNKHTDRTPIKHP